MDDPVWVIQRLFLTFYLRYFTDCNASLAWVRYTVNHKQSSATNPTTDGSFYFIDDDEVDDPEEQCTPDTVDDDGVDDDSEGHYAPDTVGDDGLAAADDRAQDDFDDEDVDDDDVD